MEKASFAAGCFWGVEGVFEQLTGVTSVVSGYSGGDAASANYETVSTGTTGHAESVLIHYDPQIISYGTLLKIFFSVAHNPTELNYQGPDHGSQYRSAIFYENPEQKKTAEDYIALLTREKIFPGPIVTQIVPLKKFYPAEDYHQNFMAKNPNYPYIVMWDRPKVQALKQLYPQLIKKN